MQRRRHAFYRLHDHPVADVLAAIRSHHEHVAHGGTGGVIVESMLVIGILALFLVVWLRSRAANEKTDE